MLDFGAMVLTNFPPMPLCLFFTLLMSFFGLFASTLFAGVIKVCYLRRQVGTYWSLMGGALPGVAIAIAALFAMLASGLNLFDRFLGDLAWNGAAIVSVGALASMSFKARRLLAG
jgi:hypothetical protein